MGDWGEDGHGGGDECDDKTVKPEDRLSKSRGQLGLVCRDLRYQRV